MNELQVRVHQEPGVVSWNFDDLKAALKTEMDSYETAVYTDEMIPAAKKDVAFLRKLKAEVDERRKDIRKKCLEPYTVIETQAKELDALIDKPINLINGQIKDFETEQKEKRKEKIVTYMNEAFKDAPSPFDSKAKFKVWDNRWLNKTYPVKDWQEKVDAMAAEVRQNLKLLDNTEPEFKQDALNAYAQELDFSEAVACVQRLKEQRERFLAAERKRQEEAERRRQEEERRAAEEAARKAAAEVARAPKRETAQAAPTVADVIASTEREAFRAAVAAPEPGHMKTEQAPPVDAAAIKEGTAKYAAKTDDGSILLRVYGTEKQQNKILEYIRFLGVKCDKL